MSKQKTIVQLQSELDAIIGWFEGDEVDIDMAIDKFKQGKKIIAELQARVQDVELQIAKIQIK